MVEELPILTDKQNNFVKEYFLNGLNATEAYRTAYKSSANTATCCVEASRLLKNPKISPWIRYFENIKSKHIEDEIKYSIDDAFKEFDEMKIIALESRDKDGRPNVSAANKAIEMKCKLKGLMKDDAQVNNSVVVQMGEVEVDGESFELKIGESIKEETESQ